MYDTRFFSLLLLLLFLLRKYPATATFEYTDLGYDDGLYK